VNVLTIGAGSALLNSPFVFYIHFDAVTNQEVHVRLPKLIYEAYPVLYILGGITTMYLVGSTVAFCSGFLLGLSGTIILFLRRNYRAIRQHLYSY